MSTHSLHDLASPRSAVLPGNRDAWGLAVSAAHDGLWYFETGSNAIHLCPRARALLGVTQTSVPPSAALLLRHIHSHDAPALKKAATALLDGRRNRAEVEVRLLFQSGTVRWAQISMRVMRDGDGRVTVIAGSLADIDQRKIAEQFLRDESRMDALTGLPNRSAFAERLTARIARATASPEAKYAVLYLDLDRFKIVNDSLGHAAGDALLIEAAARFSAGLGAEDFLARLGGDEFIILLEEVNAEGDVLRVAAALHEAFRTPINCGRIEVFTSVSVGVRMSGEGPTKPSDVVRDSDLAMYHAKRLGGGRTAVFDQRMHREMVERLHVQNELHHALQREELRVEYQPIFDLQEQRLSGFEAFLRWQHPTRGRVRASDFVTAANETGLIVRIGRWVLNEVCAQLAEWRNEYPNALTLTVTLNLCDREVLDPDFVESIENALRVHGLPPHHLTLEMSEGAMMANAHITIPALRHLRDLGVNIQMDGFGRGSASLTALRRMPLSAIKIDRSLVDGIATDEESRNLVATISAFARALGQEVLVEGIETREQFVAVAGLGTVRYVQGVHFGAPVGEVETEELLDYR